jgi:hypothetical protein
MFEDEVLAVEEIGAMGHSGVRKGNFEFFNREEMYSLQYILQYMYRIFLLSLIIHSINLILNSICTSGSGLT